jgi:hypothetical protein
LKLVYLGEEPKNTNKKGYFRGPEGYLCPKRSSSRSDDEVFGLLPRLKAFA